MKERRDGEREGLLVCLDRAAACSSSAAALTDSGSARFNQKWLTLFVW